MSTARREAQSPADAPHSAEDPAYDRRWWVAHGAPGTETLVRGVQASLFAAAVVALIGAATSLAR